MQKNIFILNGANDVNPYQDRAHFDPVAVSNLDSLINDYYNLICVTCIENVDSQTAEKILYHIDTKLRPGGEALIVITDRRKLCQLFLDNTIDESEFLQNLATCKNEISIDRIVNSLQNFEVINIAKSNSKQTIHLGKKAHANQM